MEVGFENEESGFCSVMLFREPRVGSKTLHSLQVTSDCNWRNTYVDFHGIALKVTPVPL